MRLYEKQALEESDPAAPGRADGLCGGAARAQIAALMQRFCGMITEKKRISPRGQDRRGGDRLRDGFERPPRSFALPGAYPSAHFFIARGDFTKSDFYTIIKRNMKIIKLLG
jgi:hypothetical protein